MRDPSAHAWTVLRPAGSFDGQAPLYDARAGLPAPAAAAVARSVVACSGARPGDLIVEVGAGTGEIGRHLSALPIRYLGVDDSAPMLRVFRAKAADPVPALILADCNGPWPLRERSVAVVFGSRVVHLLDAEHITREVRRVCRPAGHLVLGRVQRADDGVKERLRRRRRELLVEAGFAPHQGEEGTRLVVARCRAAGGEPLGRQVVAEWTGVITPGKVLAGWESLTRMGAIALEPPIRAGILDELRAWARVEFGDLDRSETFRERYAIDVVRLP